MKFWLIFVLLLPWSVLLGRDWFVDPDNSELSFIATWEQEPVAGGFANFRVVTDFDPNDLQQSRLNVQVDMTSVTADSSDLSETLLGELWFNAEAFPEAVFAASNWEKVVDGGYIAVGEIEIKGIRQELLLPFSWSETADNAHMVGSVVLDRRWFEVGSGEFAEDPAVGFSVKVEFDLQLVSQ